MRQVLKLVLSCVVLGSLALAGDYRFVKIDFPSATSTRANGINARGDVVGLHFDTDGVGHGYLLHKDVFSKIDFHGASLTAAFGLNARGDIAGRFIGADGNDHGFLLSEDRR
ncbi:MAG: hypothetical protein ACRD3L_03850 [Terriglobales bacterium]